MAKCKALMGLAVKGLNFVTIESCLMFQVGFVCLGIPVALKSSVFRGLNV